MRKLIILSLMSLCFFFPSLGMTNIFGPTFRYQTSKVGCFLPQGSLNKWNCTEQLLNYEILRRLNFSPKKESQNYLSKMVLERARYFLHQGVFDYQSVVSLMVFPIQGKKKWLKLFSDLKNGVYHYPYADIALQRVQGKRPQFCGTKRNAGPKRLPVNLKEICTLKIL